MRPRALIAVLILTGAPPVMMDARAGTLSGSLWLGASGLQSRLTENGEALELRAEHGGLLGNLFSGIGRGTLLLRAHRTGDSFSGTAYVFASGGCVFPYPVTGTIEKAVISWRGPEPKQRVPNSCRVTRTEFVTTAIRLKWTPPTPAPPAQVWVPPPPVVKVSPPARTAPEPSDFPESIIVAIRVALALIVVIAIPLAAFALRWAYLSLAAILTDARLALAEKRSRLAAVPPAPSRNATGLSSAEIENMLAAGFPDIEPELRASLARVLAAAIKDKNGA
jgi:hypothetical protein